MNLNCGQRPLLGSVLKQQGVLRDGDVELALDAQTVSDRPLGEVLVELGFISRPTLARALAAQSGIQLEEDVSFGSGLRARIEGFHLARRGLQPAVEPAERPLAEPLPPRARKPEHLLGHAKALDIASF
jgi:hypothetical protein